MTWKVIQGILISTSGVTNAITINSHKIIISGHQRVRACNVLGIEEVSYKLIDYENEEKEIKDLIESNLRQRVLGNTNPVKLGRCFEFLNKWYGFGIGTNQHSLTKVLCSSEPHNQKELAQSYGITQQTMNNYMRMASMIPELEDLADAGLIPFSLFIDDTESEYVFEEITEENCWIIKNLIDGRYFTASTEFMQEYELLED